MALFTFIIIGVINFFVLFYSFKIKDFLNPLIVFLFPIFLSYSTYYLYFYQYKSITLESSTFIVYLISIFSFVIGYIFLTFFSVKNKSVLNLKNNKKLKSITKIYIFVGLIGFFISLYFALVYSLSGPKGFFFNLRYANTVQNKEIHGKYLFLFFKVAGLIYIYNRKKWGTSKVFILVLLLIFIITPFFTMARTALFMNLLSILVIYLLSNNKSNLKLLKDFKYISLAGLFLISSFFGYAFLTNKISNGILNTFLRYLGYPIISFNNYILEFGGVGNGSNVFYPLFKIADVFIDIKIKSTGELVNLPPGVFNVFSFIADPYIDFNIIGNIFILFFLGLLFRYIYMKAKSNNLFFILLYSLTLFPLMLSFYAYTFKYVSWIYYFLILVLLLVLSKIRIKIR